MQPSSEVPAEEPASQEPTTAPLLPNAPSEEPSLPQSAPEEPPLPETFARFPPQSYPNPAAPALGSTPQDYPPQNYPLNYPPPGYPPPGYAPPPIPSATGQPPPYGQGYAPYGQGYAPYPSQAQGDGTNGLIPYKNPAALTAYYLAVFALIPCLGLILAPAALVLGLMGLKHAKANPQAKGTVHAWIGIVGGGLITLAYIVLFLIGSVGASR